MKKIEELKNRISEYPNRVRDQNNNLYEFEPDEGNVEQIGDLICAEKINPVINGINDLSFFHSTEGENSTYKLALENWLTSEGSCIPVWFKSGSVDKATMQINEEEIYDIMNSNDDGIIGSELINKFAFLMFDGEKFILFSSGSGAGSGFSDLPVGAIIEFFGDELPNGFDYCDGLDGRPLLISNGIVDIATGKETFLGYKTNGKWTYAKKVQTGGLPNATAKEISTGLTDVEYFQYNGNAFNGANKLSLPNSSPFEASNIHVNVSEINNQITIQTGIDRTAYTSSYIDVKYTKNNDSFEPQYKIIKTKSGHADIYDSKQIGEVGITYLSEAPYNCKIIDGENWSKSEYHKLWAKAKIEIESGINTLFIDIDDNYFKVKLPQFPVSKNSEIEFNVLGKQGGKKEHTLSIAEMPNHYHGLSNGVDYLFVRGAVGGLEKIGITTNSSGWWSDEFKGASTFKAEGGNQPHDNKPPYTVVNFYICYDTTPYTENLNNLDEKLEEINNKVSVLESKTIKKGVLTYNAFTKIEAYANDLIKNSDGLVTLNFGGTVNISSNTTIMTIPEEFRPKGSIYTAGIVDGIVCQIAVTSGGNVNYAPQNGTVTIARGFVSWYV